MQVNSIDFAIFLPIVFAIYWLLRENLKLQNLLILAASYVFYGWWDWKFLALIFISSLLDYSIALELDRGGTTRQRKILLWSSVVVNLGFLASFKYYGFFVDNFVSAFSFFGSEIKPNTLNIILPIGISFYTFQTLSYTIDVYRRKIDSTKDIVAFFAFVSFFPQLVAGPIERAQNLLPQFYVKRKFDYSKAADGMRQILWGLFKKIVIADNCAKYANLIFDNSADHSGSTLVLGALFFTFQIYGDFSGYSDIAIGTARLLGIDLKKNFAFPYFSRNIAEFWRRWHISLTSWFKNYVYFPLGGSRGKTSVVIRNIFILFLVSGFWHGANYTYLFWGALNAIYFLPLLLFKTNRNNLGVVALGKTLPSVKEVLGITLTFTLTVFAWIFFRATSLDHAFGIIADIFSPSLFTIPTIDGTGNAQTIIIVVAIFMLIEWLGREGEYAIEHWGTKYKTPVRYLLYYAITIALIWFKADEQPFIYFQF
ncbi:MAG: MBOAT family protein [Flavobacteriales bacterium]|nr:MBOAT family protein [Flavobacteriales bacterium]